MSNELIPEGYYQATVTGEVEYGNGAKGEQVAIQLELETSDGPRIAWTKLFFSPDATEYAMARLDAIGWKGGPIERTKGAKCRVGVKYESYEDRKTGERKLSAKVSIVTGGGFKFEQPLDDNQKNAFLQRLSQYKPPAAPAQKSGNGGGGGSRYGTSGQGGSAKHSAPVDDSDIPF